LILAGADKTIRVIDTKTWKEKRKILGQIGEGIKGQIYAIALSPDSKYLAVGGALYNEEGGYDDIRIYDYKSGRIIKVLKSLSEYAEANPVTKRDSVFDLDFSSKGRYLAAGSRNNEVYVFDAKQDFKKIYEDYRRNDVYAVKIIKKNKDNCVVSTSYDGTIALACFTEKKVKTNTYLAAKVTTKEYKLPYSLRFLDAKGGHIAVAGKYNNKISIFNYDLKLLKTINGGPIRFGQLQYNPYGAYLAVGSVESPFKVHVYDRTKDYQLAGVFSGHTNTILGLKFANASTIISSGGNNYETFVYKVKYQDTKNSNKYSWSNPEFRKKARKLLSSNLKEYQKLIEKQEEAFYEQQAALEIKGKQIVKKIQGVGKAVYSLGINGDNIAFGNIPINMYKTSTPLEKSISLKNFKILPKITDKFKQISTKNGEYSLASKSNGYVSKTLKILKNGDVKDTIVRDKNSGVIHNVYGWYKDYIISGGSNGVITVYDKSGDELGNFIGHIGEVYALAVDENRLISGGSDQTIKIWDLSKIGKENKIKPMVNIFITEDDEYIVWTKEGFFDASKKGGKYIGYHINRGSTKAAEYVPVDNLYTTFYRPDLIRKALKGESLETFAKNINIDNIIKDGLAPDVNILTKSQKTKKEDINLKLQVCPKDKGGYDNLALTINDMPVKIIDTSRALKIKRKAKRNDCFTYDQTITLSDGKNKIGFKATNQAGNIESKTDYIEVSYNNTKSIKRYGNKLKKARKGAKINDLHILTIAVNKYNDKELQLNYSINDANGMLKTIKKVAKPLFKKVHTYTLFDDKVTKENINKIFKNIKSKREDVFLLYIAGHGITDEYNGNYYFIPHNFINKADENAVQKQGVGQKDFMFGLSNITALKSLVLLDTCNSGSFVEADMQKTTTNRLAKATGRATISASSKSQVALEGFNDHGVFTYTLLEALKGKGYKGDNKITTNELSDYVEEILPNRTYKKWGYRQIPQKSMYGVDFKLGVK
jgi:WD40 repeat protein